MKNLEETDRKKINSEKKRGQIFEGTQGKIAKMNLLERQKYSFPQRSINTWNGLKEVIMAKSVYQLNRMTGEIQIWIGPHKSVAQVMYTTTS